MKENIGTYVSTAYRFCDYWDTVTLDAEESEYRFFSEKRKHRYVSNWEIEVPDSNKLVIDNIVAYTSESEKEIKHISFDTIVQLLLFESGEIFETHLINLFSRDNVGIKTGWVMRNNICIPSGYGFNVVVIFPFVPENYFDSLLRIGIMGKTYSSED